MNTLEADSIIVDYDERTVLHNVYLRCTQDEIVGLLGRNGCGKSTLLKTIFGSLQPLHKSIRINGKWLEAGYMQSKVVMLPQTQLIPSNKRIGEAMRLFGVRTETIAFAGPELIPLLDHKPGQLSGGELRFLELLMVLYSQSLFCLLDEPFSGLSPVMIERSIIIMNEVKKIKGLVVTDHLHRYVTSCCDRYYYMHEGRVLQLSDVNELVRYGYVTSLD